MEKVLIQERAEEQEQTEELERIEELIKELEKEEWFTAAGALLEEWKETEDKAWAEFAGTGDVSCLTGEVLEHWAESGRSPFEMAVLAHMGIREGDNRHLNACRRYLAHVYLEGTCNTTEVSLFRTSCEQKAIQCLLKIPKEDGKNFLEVLVWGNTYYGKGDYKTAEQLLSRISEPGPLGENEDTCWGWTVVTACENLANIYERGLHGEPAEPMLTLWYLLYAAENFKNREAAYRAGMLYRGGKGIEKDYPMAFKYLTMAANMGHPAACAVVAFGLLFQHEWVGNQTWDEKNILRYIEDGVKGGQNLALYCQGVMHCICGLRRDAIADFQQLIGKEGYKQAEGILGQLYFMQGETAAAVSYLKKACEEYKYRTTIEAVVNAHAADDSQKMMGPCECMGYCYAYGEGGCERDVKKAVYYLEEARKLGTLWESAPLYLIKTYLGQKNQGFRNKGFGYWLEEVNKGSSYIPEGLSEKMVETVHSKPDSVSVDLVFQCQQQLRHMAEAGKEKAVCEYTQWLVFREGQFTEMYTDNGKVHKFYRYGTFYSTGLKSERKEELETCEEYLKKAEAVGMKKADLLRGYLYLFHEMDNQAHDYFQKAAKEGWDAAKEELTRFRRGLLGSWKYPRD